MEKVGTTKIIKKSSKPEYAYPFIRLPRAFKDIVGNTASIYTTNHGGKKAFLIVLDQGVEQPQNVTSFEFRIKALETNVEQILRLHHQNWIHPNDHIEKKAHDADKT